MKNIFCCLFFVIMINLVAKANDADTTSMSDTINAKPNANLMALTSLIIPGTGQFFNREYKVGITHLGLSALFWGTSTYLQNQSNYIKDIDDDNKEIKVNGLGLAGDFFSSAALNLHFYSAFQAYQKASLKNASVNNYKISDETFTQLAFAPFKIKHLKRPTTYLPLLVAITTNFIIYKDIYGIRRDEKIPAPLFAGSMFMKTIPAPIGEEAFFRGTLNTEISNRFGNIWGLTLSSVAFGAPHLGIGNQAGFIEATIIGAYWGWLQQRNDFRIGEGVCIHFWWNLISHIFAISKGGVGALRISFTL